MVAHLTNSDSVEKLLRQKEMYIFVGIPVHSCSFLSLFLVQFLDNVLVKSCVMIGNITKRTIYLQVMW